MFRFCKAVFIALAALGVIVILVTVVPFTNWWAAWLAGRWAEPDGDVLIVLSGDTPVTGIIGQSSYWRALYVVRAWQSRHFRTIVISGGEGTAESIRDFLICHAIPGAIIQIENLSTSTHQNATFTIDLLKRLPGRKVLLTSDYHMYRALAVYRRLGIELEPYPIPDAIKHSGFWWNRWSVFLRLVVETGKIVGYRVRGWM
jgi:uncharacterized SAM-binding protein YcdF (DUF218 family)